MYIHFESIYDSGHLFDVLVNKFDDEKDFYELWENEQLKYVKTILFLFSVSHLIIVIKLILVKNFNLITV